MKKNSPGVDFDPYELEAIGIDGDVDSTVYCTCRQVSYGEMIGCDNDDCEIEWVRHESEVQLNRLIGAFSITWPA